MAVARITLTSLESADSVVISPPDDQQPDSYIALDVDPKGMYGTAFTARTQSGAFEPGGRIVGTKIPIREVLLPLWLDSRSRSRLQKMFGTPGNFKKVRYTVDTTVSGPRWVTLKLSKEIDYATEDGLDADIDDMYHAGVIGLAVQPNFESPEDVSSWTNPHDRFTVAVVASGGTFPLSFGGQTALAYTVAVVGSGGTFPLSFGGQTASAIPFNAAPSTVQSALSALSSVGPGKVTVTGTPGNYFVAFGGVTGSLTSSATNLTGTNKSVTVGSGIPWNASADKLQSALSVLSSVGPGNVTVTGTPATANSPSSYLVVFAVGVNGVLTSSPTNLTGTGLFWLEKSVTIEYAPNTGWFSVWNPTDQPLWKEWTFDPAKRWQFPDFSFGGERKFGRPVGVDAARMIVTPELTQMLSVMSDPLQDTYINADLSNAAGLFAGVHPVYMVPPYTQPVMMPVICQGPAGSKVTLRQRRFWSAESGLEE